ncbi:hypothetical protein SEA_SPILLED_207 [Streptomyces phage Spilled]|uniref:Uncharacterized protein n=4 Tax=Streptomyces virus Karimac TaxID=2846401 RepID=A0A5Q2WPX3_9CAUD|nr:hypothetical protein HWB80_gp118 [Streptomyces phage Karimac]AXH66666.1 hypothetical protein SEA_STARBOW_198 [Streptomyces phage Starbow]QGH79928.1 hypothetical protein SEA_BORDEAUX_199 [Streptomyces phage Bordeaux]QRI45845.1 hypothetical protein SEA_BATTUTA_198 [Streptomyces phage Battuta]UVK60061.1 hypothetical protein SEA_SPILLED_207 [Streptomyces phage Spilled]AXH70024.1 hypothetical protein SEA_KARIMAC_201 [Streptomyces phage Karimac]
MQLKMYAIACDQAEAIKNCFTGKYTNQPFWPEHRTLVPYLERAREENPGLPLKIFVIKVSG